MAYLAELVESSAPILSPDVLNLWRQTAAQPLTPDQERCLIEAFKGTVAAFERMRVIVLALQALEELDTDDPRSGH